MEWNQADQQVFFKSMPVRYSSGEITSKLHLFLFIFLVSSSAALLAYLLTYTDSYLRFVLFIMAVGAVRLLIELIYNKMTEKRLTLIYDKQRQVFDLKINKERQTLSLGELQKVRGELYSINKKALMSLFVYYKLVLFVGKKEYVFTTNRQKIRGKLEYFYQYVDSGDIYR